MEPSEVRRRLAGYSKSAATLAARQWRTMRTLDDWPKVATRLTVMVQANMVAAARFASTEAVAALESDVTVAPGAWGRVASDGRPLDSLLYSGVVHARSLYGSGRTDEQIMQAGLAWMQSVIGTQVQDVARSASGTVTTATDGAGWIRYVNVPCCQRCAVLAGKWFKWNQGFSRHPPTCKCIHRPARRGNVPPGWTQQVEDSQIRDLTEAQRKALAEGADRTRVLNAYRNSNSTSERLAMHKSAERGGILTPEGIYARATTREEAIELLRRYGYLL